MMLLTVLLLGLAGSAIPPADMALMGRWWNSDGSVAVDVARCGDRLCGKVVYAERRQQDKARRAGVNQMLGLAVMRNFQGAGPGHWKGIVFVPERNRAFRSTISRLASDRVSVEGCMLFILCQRETWKRSR
ncbi:MAG TPA: DUF2147 domain-containing protein [Allosphingosinicella sp.]|nr:DUF2147 domain-containing protein [Allosphingosinicella sp.]